MGNTENTLHPAATPDDLTLDSTYFVAFEMTHDALKSGLRRASTLSVTQYRVLIKLLGAAPGGIAQTDLGALLNLKANVVTQAINVLEAAGFAGRTRGRKGDSRIRIAQITETGIAHVSEVNDSLIERLYALFPTDSTTYRSLLEGSISAGAALDPPLPKEVAQRYFASRTLTSFELVRKAMEAVLKRVCGASLHECRIMQRLDEVGSPLRPVDLARQLRCSPVTVARSVERLSRRGWVQRLASPADRKAVYIGATGAGVLQQHAITHALNEAAREYLWGKLNGEQRRAVMRAGHEVIGDLQAKEEAAHKALLGLLQPL